MTVTGAAQRTADSTARAFWYYWSATVSSTVGSAISAVALPLVALAALGASNFEVGLLTAASYGATVLIGLPAGVLVQRFALRGLQVGLDVFRAVAVASIPVAAWWDALTLAQLLLVAFLVGLASNLFDVANATFLPRVVPRDELIARNSLMSGTHATTQLGGPALGGLLVQVIGAVAAVVVDALSYLVSAVLLRQIPATAPPAASPAGGFLRQIAVGLRYVVRHPVMRPAMLAATAVNFANGAVLAVIAPFVVRTLGLPAGVVGLVLAADGLGTVIGAALTARLVRRYGSARALLLATAAGPVLGLAMPLAMTSWAVGIFGFGLAGLAAGVVVLSVVTRTHRQTVSPPELLFRVMASVRFISWGAIPVGALLAGAAAEVWSPRAGLVIAVTAAFAAPVAVWTSRIRGLRDLTDVEPAVARSAVAQPGVARPEATGRDAGGR